MKKLIVLLGLILLFQTSFSQELIWTFKTGGSIHSSPVIQDGIIYIGSGDKKLYALDKSTGKKLWYYKSKGAIYSDVSI